MVKSLRYITEAAVLHLLFLIFRILPVDAASAVGGWTGRNIGPRLAASRKALKNLERAFPDFDEKQKQVVLKGMWENLGRVIAEYPHLETIGKDRVELVNTARLEESLSQNKPVILFTAHMANWEVAGPSIFKQKETAVAPIYRAPNNNLVNKMLLNARTLKGRIPAYAKSKTGTRQLVQAVKNKQPVGILIDQKYNEGIAVPFFGHPAMTSPAFVQLAQKFKADLIPSQIERADGAHFKVTFHEPLALFDDNGTPLPVETVMGKAHSQLEGWIRQRPEQWLWLHRRWPKQEQQHYQKAA